MTREQWTVLGLLVVLASLEIIRSTAVKGFFSNFFGQFGVGSSSSSSAPTAPTPFTGTTLPAGAAIKGFPTNSGTPPKGTAY